MNTNKFEKGQQLQKNALSALRATKDLAKALPSSEKMAIPYSADYSKLQTLESREVLCYCVLQQMKQISTLG